ncbi:MAG: hypothetical protein ACK53T_07785 [Planctomycetota bacterium]|jgi:hypothetical protein
MDVSLDQVLNSKVYVKEDSLISFGSPRQYIEPFVEKLQGITNNFRVSVSDRVANKEESGSINEAYGRVLIEAKLPNEFCAYDHDSVIGMVYALDTQKPTMRVYSGENAWACTNLSIFGARYIHQVELLQGNSSIYEKAYEYVDSVTEQLHRFREIYERMNEKVYEGDDINRVVGYLLREGSRNKQIGTSAILSAVKDLDDNKSRYAIRENKVSQWNVYSAVTQYITDKVDIVDKASKTVVVSNLFIN